MTGTLAESANTDQPQSVDKITVAIAMKNWKQPESRIHHIIWRLGVTTGRRNSYRCDFEATNEMSVTDCDGHTHIYKRSAT